MDKFIYGLVFLISKLAMIVSFDDTLRKYYVFWITVGLMRGASKYKLFYLRWICLLCVHDVNMYLCTFCIRSIICVASLSRFMMYV